MSTPVNPPTIQPLPTTPAQEWARDTTSAFDSNRPSGHTDPAVPHFANANETYQPVPGSFPRGADLSAPPTAEDTQKAAQGILDSARLYIPAQEDIQKALQNASETAKQYLPESVSAYLAGSNSLPSKEVPSGSSVGVGSLPGNMSESSVAKLPEERAQEGTLGSETSAESQSSSLPTHEVPSGSKVGVGSLPGEISESGVAKLPEERAQERSVSSNIPDTLKTSTTGIIGTAHAAINDAAQTAKEYMPASVTAHLPGSTTTTTKDITYNLPSTEVPSGSRGGIGSLPGNASEVSVAKLPEERRQEGLPSHETRNEVLGKTGGVGPLPGGPNESKVALLPEERRQQDLPSHELGHDSLGKSGGVGTLPGGPDESKVALLPEERRQQDLPSHEMGHDSLGKSSGVGSNEASAAPLPEKRTHGTDGILKSGSENVGTAAPADIQQPSTLSPSHTTSTTSKTHAAASEKSTPVGHANGASTEHHKVSVMDKVKGEVKVISGKLSKDEKKVEEGKHMMGK